MVYLALAAAYLLLAKPKKACSCSTDPSCCDKPAVTGQLAAATSGARRPTFAPPGLVPPVEQTAAAAPGEGGEGELLGQRGSDEGTVFSGEPEEDKASPAEAAVESEAPEPLAPGATASDDSLLTDVSASRSQSVKTAAVAAARLPADAAAPIIARAAPEASAPAPAPARVAPAPAPPASAPAPARVAPAPAAPAPAPAPAPARVAPAPVVSAAPVTAQRTKTAAAAAAKVPAPVSRAAPTPIRTAAPAPTAPAAPKRNAQLTKTAAAARMRGY